LGTETFTWDNTDQNYIGISARQNNAGWSTDNLLIEANAFDFDPPARPTLTLNRDSGNLAFSNPTDGQAISLIGYTIQTADGGFDREQWMQVDDLDVDDEWFELTSSGNPVTDLSEATLGEYTLQPGQTIDFGDVWIQSPFEELLVEFRDFDGNVVTTQVVKVGNNGEPFLLGDFDLQNGIDAADWEILRSSLISDVDDSLFGYQLGDITRDGFVDGDDFDAFKLVYEAANGEGSFAALVPEPSSALLLILGGALLLRFRRKKCGTMAAILVSACFLGPVTDKLSAQELFFDSFDRGDNTDIDGETTGMSGTFAPISYIEENNGLVAGSQPEYTNITNNALDLADGPNASTFYLDRNFNDSVIISDGVFSVSLDILSNNGNTTDIQRFVGFGVGSALTELQDQSLYDFNATVDSPAIRGANTGNGFADLFVDWTPNGGGAIQLYKNGNLTQSFDDGVDNAVNLDGYLQPGGTDGVAVTLELRMAVSSFDSGSTVPVTIYYDGVAVGGDAIRWDNTNQNYIGVAARQSLEGMTVDNLAIRTSTDSLDVQTLSLEVNTATGEAFLIGGPGVNTIDRYTIASDNGMESQNFNGIGGDGVPAGDGSGNGWELGGVQTDSLLNEFYLLGESALDEGFRASLGNIYDTATDNRDLFLEYRLAGGSIVNATATYITGEGVTGDFNGDGVWDCQDIDALVAEIVAGTDNPAFDMTGDGQVDADDINNQPNGWLGVGGANNPQETGGNAFLPADANLDGVVDVSDFGIWNGNKFTAVDAWCSGDFNADGVVDVSDFGLWNGNKFTSSSDAAAAVPEPVGSVALLLMTGLAWGWIRKVRRG
ncbi:MAG: PEP-CTERM sorting domain-containing protein, partial [Planctomycetota bacterium]